MISWLAETFIAVTLLMLLVLLVRGSVARAFGAGWAYALWLVPALRLVLPPLPELSPEIALPDAMFIIPMAAGPAASLPAEAGPGQWVPLMLALWAGGAVVFLTLQWLAYRGFLKRLAANARRARPPSYGGIATWISSLVEGPLALGLLERKIVVPADFSRRYSPGERRLAMEHELTHHRHGDIFWNVAAIVFLALNWFNPVAWVAFRAFRSDQELACDSAVAARATPGERHDYARALVKSASTPGLVAACPLRRSEELKRRLRMIARHRSSRVRAAGGIAAVAAFALAGFTVASPGLSRQAPLETVTEIVYAAAPALAAKPEPQTIVVTAPKVRTAARPSRASAPGRAARPKPPRAAATPAAPEPVEPIPSALAALERALPELAVAVAPQPPQAMAAAAVWPPAPHAAEAKRTPSHGRKFRFRTTTRRVFVVAGDFSDEEKAQIAALIERAIADAAAAGHPRGSKPDRLRVAHFKKMKQSAAGGYELQLIEQGEGKP